MAFLIALGLEYLGRGFWALGFLGSAPRIAGFGLRVWDAGFRVEVEDEICLGLKVSRRSLGPT